MSNGEDGNLIIPRHIVVAVSNSDRMRELSPTASGHAWDESLFRVPIGGGGGVEFLQFLSEELIPHVDSTYRTTEFRILAGHSIAGLFSLYALMETPNSFNAVIAIDPSLCYPTGSARHSYRLNFSW